MHLNIRICGTTKIKTVNKINETYCIRIYIIPNAYMN